MNRNLFLVFLLTFSWIALASALLQLHEARSIDDSRCHRLADLERQLAKLKSRPQF